MGKIYNTGFDPILEITCENQNIKINGYKNLNEKTTNPRKYIKEIIDENKSFSLSKSPPLSC